MVQTYLQPCLSGGEISPSLYARVDASSYSTWLKTAQNMFIHAQGGVSNRAGTKFRGISKNGGKCRLIPFVISEQESYVLEMGESYIRFYTPAGILLNGANPYEVQTDYQTEELDQLHYVQNNHTLYLTHPSHAPRRLIRTAAGVFTWEKIPLRYGPFQPSNKNETHQLRVYQTQDQAETTGVKATLSLQPLSYEQYVVWAYFNDEWFYAAADYGLNLNGIVSKFNERYASQGLTASNLGGIIKVESPAATGGDWNGSTLTLAYMEALDAPPVFTVQQTLSGGANAGTLLPQGETRYVLESSSDYFTPSHVDGKFLLSHRIDGQYLTGVLGYETTSAAIKSGGDWRVRTSGNWTGQIVVETSSDLGTTWHTVKTLSRVSGDDNFAVMGDLNDDENMFLIRVRSVQISGEAGYELEAEPFAQDGVVTVKTFVNAQKVIVEIERAFGSDGWTSTWKEGSFSPKCGYPRCIFFFQDRLGFAATANEPQTLWFSKIGAYTDFGHARLTVKDSDTISVNLSGKKLNEIRAVAVTNRLLVFTAGSEWTLSSEGNFTPYNIRLEQQSEHGAYFTLPLMAGNKALFVQSRGSVVRNFYYDYNTASYASTDLTLRARHLFFNRTVREMCLVQEPDPLVWVVLDEGTLLSLTYASAQNICAWAHHQTQGFFRSVCAIAQTHFDEVWFAVERNGTYCIESMVNRLSSKDPKDQVFLDSCVSKQSETGFTQVTGLGHLEGKKVSILGDGNPLPSVTVTNGAVTLSRSVSCAHVGLAYESKLETLPAILSVANAGKEQKKRIVSVVFKMLDSRGGCAGADDNTLTCWLQHHHEKLNEVLPLETGDFSCAISGVHSHLPSVIFKQTEPLPVTVLAVVCRFA
jgi:hypothetical protein